MALQKQQSPKKKAPRRRNRHGVSATGPSKARGAKIGPARSKGSADPKNSFDGYIALARAAAASGNAVDAENYYQHAEHYFRLMKQKTA